MKIDFDQIAEQGEESGREEAADDFPYLPENPNQRDLYYRGRGRAQGLYELRGKAARIFAQNFAMGYDANIALYEDDYPDELKRARSV